MEYTTVRDLLDARSQFRTNPRRQGMAERSRKTHKGELERRGEALFAGPLRHVRSAALAAALVPVGLVAATPVTALAATQPSGCPPICPPPPTVPEPSTLLLLIPAAAGLAARHHLAKRRKNRQKKV